MTAIFTPANDREARFLDRAAKAVGPEHAKGVSFDGGYTTSFVSDSNWSWLAGSYGYLYRRQPAVRTVVDFLARNIAQLNLKIYLRLDNADRMEVDDHPLAQLLRNPNPTTSTSDFIRDTVADKAIYDVAYWRLDRPIFPQALIRVPPSRIQRRIVAGTTFQYYGPGGEAIPRNELVVFSGYSPEGAWCNEDGVSPLETLRRVLQEEFAAQSNRENFWRNASRRDGVIQRPGDAPEWSDVARDRFRTDWENRTAGASNAGRAPVLEDGMVWNPDSFSPKDSEYIAGRQLFFEEVARQYGIAPKLFGMGDIANANIDAFHRQLYQDTLGPWLKSLQDTIELQLLPAVDTSDPKTRARIYTEFNLAAKLAGSFEEQARTLTTAAGVPIVARNEARAKLNLPRIDDKTFDIPVTPLNVMVGGQPAVTIPTAVPEPKARGPKTKRVAPRSVIRRRDDAVKAHAELFRRYFKAQRQAFEKKATSPDTETWDGKLTGLLYAARVTLAGKTGALAAGQIDGVYDSGQTLNYLSDTAHRQAKNINAQTAKALTEADDPAGVWDIATTSRTDYLALSTVTSVVGFARTEAARQSQAADGRERQKVWVVVAGNSRHPQMDGEAASVDEAFSNGCHYPGDADGGVDEVAGCSCLMDLV